MNEQGIDHKLAGTGGGGWDESTHRTLYPNNFNFGLADYIVNRIRPSSVLEFGSGLGHLSRHIVDSLQTDQVYCIEPKLQSELYDAEKGPKLLNINIFTDAPPAEIRRKFDLVISIEVAEHIERACHSDLFDFLVFHANHWLVFSGARVGQGGHGHIAERPEIEWRDEIISRGLAFREDLTREIRLACDEKNINHRRNLMVFETI